MIVDLLSTDLIFVEVGRFAIRARPLRSPGNSLRFGQAAIATRLSLRAISIDVDARVALPDQQGNPKVGASDSANRSAAGFSQSAAPPPKGIVVLEAAVSTKQQSPRAAAR
jgi:hypothetical protein